MPDSAFNYALAKEDGFSDEQIASHLAKERGFDLDLAIQDGFDYSQIAQHLAGEQAEPEYDRTVWGQTKEFAKAIPRGFGQGMLGAVEGIAELADAATNVIGLDDLIDSGDDNAVVAAARKGQQALNNSFMGPDVAYQDAWMTKFGQGLGSLATFLTPGVALRLSGYAGKAGKVATAAGFGSNLELGLTGTLALGTGTGEAAQRVEESREEGIDVSQGQEDAAIAWGAITGMTELAPIPGFLRRLDPLKLDDRARTSIMGRITSGFKNAGKEGVQEVIAGLMQDLGEQKIYNPDHDYGEDALDNFTIGGAAGFVADLALAGVGARRTRTFSDSQLEKERADRADREEANTARRAQYDRPPVTTAEPTTPIDTSTIPPETDDMVVYGKTLARTIGPDFPSATSFDVEEITVDLTPEELAAETPNYGPNAGQPMATTKTVFRVRDSEGVSYGVPLPTQGEAAVVAGELNSQLVDQAARNATSTVIVTSAEDYDIPTETTLGIYGDSIINPRANEVTTDALNMAAETTIDKGFDETLSADQAMNKQMGRVATEAELVQKLTAAQRANRKRLAQGLPETNTFSIEEAKDVLGKDFGKLGDIGTGATLETETYEATTTKPRGTRKGRPIVVSSAGEVIDTYEIRGKVRRDGTFPMKKRRIKTPEQAVTIAERLNSKRDSAVDELVFKNIEIGKDRIKTLLERKGITNELNSPAIRTMAKAFVGKESIEDMDSGEMKYLYQKIRKLPVLHTKQGLPNFQVPSYTTSQFKSAEAYINEGEGAGGRGRTGELDADLVAEAANIDPADPRRVQKVERIVKDLRESGRITDDVLEKPLELPPAATAPTHIPGVQYDQAELRADLEALARKELDRIGLDKTKISIVEALYHFNRDSEGNLVFLPKEVGKETQGYYKAGLNEIFFGIDKLVSMKEKGATPDEIWEEIKDLLNHETVHAMRELDLWTADEWALLERTAGRTKVPKTSPLYRGENETFLERAAVLYPDLADKPTAVMEEAIADMIRDGRRIGGKPRTLINRIRTFFESMMNFLRGSGFRNFNGLIEAIESGEIGAREVGPIRTLRETRKKQRTLEVQALDPDWRPTAKMADAPPEVVEEEVSEARRGRGKTAEEIAEQGGPLSTKLSLAQIGRALENEDYVRDIEIDTVEEARRAVINGEAGSDPGYIVDTDTGITVVGLGSLERFTRKNRPFQKTFKEGTRLGTLRDWLGYGGDAEGRLRPPVIEEEEVSEVRRGRATADSNLEQRDFWVPRIAELQAPDQYPALLERALHGTDLVENPLSLLEMLALKTDGGYGSDRRKFYRRDFREIGVIDRELQRQVGRIEEDIEEVETRGRRRFIKMLGVGMGSAATIATYQRAAYTQAQEAELGRAKPVSPEILKTPLTDSQMTLLEAGESRIMPGTPHDPVVEDDPDGTRGAQALRAAIEDIAANGPEEVRALAADIASFLPSTGIRLVLQRKDMTWAGSMTAFEVPGTLALYGKAGMDIDTLLHESLHANVMVRYQSLTEASFNRAFMEENELLTQEAAEAIDQFKNVWEEFRPIARRAMGGMDKNALFNALEKATDSQEEFFVRALTSGELQQWMSQQVYRGRTLYERFADWVKYYLLGGSSGTKPSWLDAALAASGDVMISFEKSPPNFAVVRALNEDYAARTAAASEEEDVSEVRRAPPSKEVRVPRPEEKLPVLPMGEVERALAALLERTGGNPTSAQLAKVPGAPTRRPRPTPNKAGKKIPDMRRDGNVRPTPLAELRQMAETGLREGVDDLQWYDQFAKGLTEIVGAANIEEASVIFGITSAQNPVADNLQDTLHIMAIAREVDPVADTAAFIKAVQERKKPGDRGMMISLPQIERIAKMYTTGLVGGGLKTTTYMQLIQDRQNNVFNPFSVHDIHMARVFGWRRKDADKETGKLTDSAQIPTDRAYRYAQYLTSYLADEFGVTPNQMQAALWFYGKKNLMTKEPGKSAGSGTWKAASSAAAPQIKVIEEQVKEGLFDKDTPLTPALEKGVRPRNTTKVKTHPYTNYLQIEELTELAKRRAPLVLASAQPGNERDYGFPATVTLEDMIVFNDGAVDVITDEDGQIPFIRKMGIPHTVETAVGSYEGVEPNIQIALLNATPEQAEFIGIVLGDGLLQDGVAIERPTYGVEDGQLGMAVTKADGSKFSQEEIMAVAAKANPENDWDGLNFTLGENGTVLRFIDGRTMTDTVAPYTEEMREEFADQVLNSFDQSVEYVYNSYRQQGKYRGHKSYRRVLTEIEGDRTGPTGPSGLLRLINSTLYEPFWDYYLQEAERIGFTPKNLKRPVRRKLIPPPIVRPPPTPIPEAKVEEALEANLKDVEDSPAGSVPPYSVKASPDAQTVGRNPDLGAKLSEDEDFLYSRNNTPELAPDIQETMDKYIDEKEEKRSYVEVFTQFRVGEWWGKLLTKTRQGVVDKHTRKMTVTADREAQTLDKEGVQMLGDTAYRYAQVMADRADAFSSAAMNHGQAEYKNGTFQVKDFMYKGNKVDGMVEVQSILMPSPQGKGGNIHGDLEAPAKFYAVAIRSKQIIEEDKNKPPKQRRNTPIPPDEIDAALLKAEAAADSFINPESGESYIREWYDMYQAYNEHVIEFMKDTGLISEEQGNIWRDNAVYYPFYREARGELEEMGNEDIDFINMFSNMDSVPDSLTSEQRELTLKKLKGSKRKMDVPLLDSVVRNYTTAIEMGMKNVADQRLIRDLVYLGQAREIPLNKKLTASVAQSVYNIRVAGKRRRFIIDDPLLFEAMKTMPESGPIALINNITGVPAKVLREMVTRDPGFMVVNMLRDSLSAYTTSGADFTPVVSTFKNFVGDITNMEKLGIVTGYDKLYDRGNLSDFLKKEARRRGVDYSGAGSKIFNQTFQRAWDMLGEGTTRSDAATRKAVYDDTLARTGNQAEAIYQAIEILNFGRRGNNQLMRMITTAIPFLNARIQGLDVFYRAARGRYSANTEASKAQIQKRFFLRGLSLLALTAAYWTMVSDTEDYEEADDYEKDNNWLIPNPFGPTIKIPVPFEVGLLFKTIPEKMLDTAFGDTTRRELKGTIQRGVGTTLEFNPLGGVQLIAPIVEAALNHNFYTGRPVVPFYIDQQFEEGLQARFNTSEFASMIGKALNMSPMKIQHVLEGYAGTIGIYGLDLLDHIMRTEAFVGDQSKKMPSMTLSTAPVLKRFFALPEGRGLVEDFYELNEEVRKVVSTLGSLDQDGRSEELLRYMVGRQHLIDLGGELDETSRWLAKRRNERDGIMKMNIPASEKREYIDRLDAAINDHLALMPLIKELADLPAFEAGPLSPVYRD